MGYVPIGIVEAAKSVVLTAILFVGPLYEAGIVEGSWRNWIRLRGLDAVISSWMGWRNMIAVRVFLVYFGANLIRSRGQSRRKSCFALHQSPFYSYLRHRTLRSYILRL